MPQYLIIVKTFISQLSVCFNFVQGAMQIQLLQCVDSLLEVMGNNCETIGYDLFTTLISIMALHRSDSIKDEVSDGSFSE